jgi:ABC-type multidrug transport system fused ATPase/permease subunit
MAIYHRTFTIPPYLSTTSTGQLVNQISADATRYLNVMPSLIMMLTAPAFIVISVSVLLYVLGPSILVGLAIMVLYIPVVRKCGLIQKRYQEQKMKLADERVRITGEVVSGIRVLKVRIETPDDDNRDPPYNLLPLTASLISSQFYAWEGPSRDVIKKARASEASKLLSFWLWQAASMVLALICPTLALVATFATYYLTKDKMPPISDTFLALSMFKLIQLPFKAFSEGVSATSQALVSFRRLEAFLSQEQLEPLGRKQQEEGDDGQKDADPKIADPLVKLSGDWTWGSDEPHVMIPLSSPIEVRGGEILAIVGMVGSGKTSIISAMLGELRPLSPKPIISLRGSVALVSQQAFIVNDTIESNVTFGLPFDRDKFNRAIKVRIMDEVRKRTA